MNFTKRNIDLKDVLTATELATKSEISKQTNK
jgi:hypothetical protein